MKNNIKIVLSMFLVFALLNLLIIPAVAEDNGVADCDLALVKCLLFCVFILGPDIAAILCLEGYAFCKMFLVN
jgi:hypothetical protein